MSQCQKLLILRKFSYCTIDMNTKNNGTNFLKIKKIVRLYFQRQNSFDIETLDFCVLNNETIFSHSRKKSGYSAE